MSLYPVDVRAGNIIKCKCCGHELSVTRERLAGICRRYFPTRNNPILYDEDLKRLICVFCGAKTVAVLASLSNKNGMPTDDRPAARRNWQICPQCGGDGGAGNRCPSCGGTGWRDG